MSRYLPLVLIVLLCSCDRAPNSQGVRESGSQGVRESGSQGVRESGSQGVRESGSQGVRESESQGVRESGSQGGRESGSQIVRPELGAAFPVAVPPLPPPPAPVFDYDTTQWTEITRLDSTIRLDLRYATANNFMEQVIYDCGRCFYRPQVARALLKVHQDLKPQNLGLKMYDCYRPGPYQQRLWDVLPDPRYVANPKRGSLHSRGAAADLTILHLDSGEELNMGTPYDFFGEEAYTTTTNLPADVMANRALFQKAMRKHGFLTIRTEWWHFNFGGPRLDLSDWVWGCE